MYLQSSDFFYLLQYTILQIKLMKLICVTEVDYNMFCQEYGIGRICSSSTGLHKNIDLYYFKTSNIMKVQNITEMQQKLFSIYYDEFFIHLKRCKKVFGYELILLDNG